MAHNTVESEMERPGRIRQKRQRLRVRKRRKCHKCNEEYCHSAFYTHKCGVDDQEDETFSLQFPLTAQSSSSDSEFYISDSNELTTVMDPGPQQHHQCDYSVNDLESGQYSYRISIAI